MFVHPLLGFVTVTVYVPGVLIVDDAVFAPDTTPGPVQKKPGLETFELRMKQHCLNAQKVAEFLESHDQIERVIYPGLKSHPQYALAQKQMKDGSNLIAFVVKGGKDGAFSLMNGLQIIDISNNLGDAKSLITHPATTTHSNIEPQEQEKLGILGGMVRLSVGLEDVDDLIGDIGQALS